MTAGAWRHDAVDPEGWHELDRADTPKSGPHGVAGMVGMGRMDQSGMPGTNTPGLGGKHDTRGC